jgi:N-acetylmuramoyl-L-alanine amidase
MIAAVLLIAACSTGTGGPSGASHGPNKVDTKKRHHHRHKEKSLSPAPSHSQHVSPPSRPLRTRTAPPPTTISIAPSDAPVIVVDPGHSVPIHAIDPRTGLDVSDYANEPEMHDVFSVAELVRSELVADGYRVIMTKQTVNTPTSLGRRAHIANAAHADLALSIHDQAGADGGIGFDDGNNIVYYQTVGDYRETPTGKKVYFTDARVAAQSKKCALDFQRARAAAQHAPMTLLGNTGYDLGSRGLPAGNIWLVQLLSHVPWIYNEAGGNSPGMVGLSHSDEQRYAAGLVAGVESCVPIAR